MKVMLPLFILTDIGKIIDNAIGSIQLYNKNDEMDTLGRVYEYFLGKFAQQEDNLVIQKFKE